MRPEPESPRRGIGRGGLEQPRDFALVQHLGETACPLGKLQRFGRVVIAAAVGHEKSVELANGRQVACLRATRVAALGELAQIVAEIIRACRFQGGRAGVQGPLQAAEVAGVGVLRVGGGLPLRREHVDEERDRIRPRGG